MLLPVELLVFAGIWLFSRYIFLWWNGRGKESHRYPPSLPSLPLVGSLPFLLRGFNNMANFFMRKSDQLGPIVSFRAGSTSIVILNSREAIEDALVNHSSAFAGRSPQFTERLINPNNRGSSITTKFEKRAILANETYKKCFGLVVMKTTQEWKKYHQLSLSILKQFGFGVKSMMESRIFTEVDYVTDFLNKQGGKSFNPRELVFLCTTNIIMNTLFGRRHDYNLGMTELGHQILMYVIGTDMALEVAPIVRFLPFYRNKLIQLAKNHKVLLKIIQIETDKSLADGADDCFVRRYVENTGPERDAEQLRYTLRDLIAAGTETTASTLLWSLIALANNPDVQDRLRAEIDAVVPRDLLPSMNDQPKLPFVDATILEIMRWRTLVPLAVPHTTLSDTNVGTYFVPAETLVLLNLYAVHMDPKVWNDPEIFRPERFLDNDGQVIRRESVIPFSLGRRSCLGEVLARSELFLILTGLVQRFIILPPEGQTIDAKPREPVMVVMAPSEFNIRLIPRD